MSLLTPVLAVVAAFVVGAVAYLYFEGLGPRGRLLAAIRGTAGALLALLLLDLTCARPEGAQRPYVLVDGSLSMDAAGGSGRAARDSAAHWGVVRWFGADPTGPDTAPGFTTSTLLPALLAASASDRPVVIVTDGALDDLRDLPSDLLARASIRLFPRADVPDAAMLRLDAPERITLGDTLRVQVEVGRFGGMKGAGTIELLGPGGRRLLTRPLPANAGQVALALPTRSLGAGDHLLEIRVRVPTDAESRDDARQILVTVTPLPGAVLLASPPDWDARQLHATLRDVAALPVKGYVRLGPNGWRSMDDQRRVTPEEVGRAARGADLLILKGDPGDVVRGARPRGLWRWPSGEGGETQLDGDWYVVPSTLPSPLSATWTGVGIDSLSPVTRVTPIEPAPGSWVGLTAQLGRRGAERPIMVGRDSGRTRMLLVAADGFWRWAFRPGGSEEAYRQLMASATNWLLAGADSNAGAASPVHRVVPLGHPIVFQWIAATPPTPVIATFNGAGLARVDTLFFDGSGHAEVRLPPGRFAYQLDRGGRGTVAVETWSAEYVPRASGLGPQASGGVSSVSRVALREQPWLYLMIVLLLCGEWWLRRRAGLR